MSFFTSIATEASTIEQEVVGGAKTVLNYVDNVVVTEIVPDLEAALKVALQTFEQAVLAGILGQLTPGATVTVPTPASTDQTSAS